MENEIKYIEVCIGVGMDQITPEYVKIPIYPETKEVKRPKKEIEIESEK